MKFIPLFTEEYETYNQMGQQLDDEVTHAIKPIIKKYLEMNCSIRDMESIMIDVIICDLGGELLLRNSKISKQKRIERESNEKLWRKGHETLKD